jgi:hypothetical protein
MACAFSLTTEHISPGLMSSPVTATYLRSDELTLSYPLVTSRSVGDSTNGVHAENFIRFRFQAKKVGDQRIRQG